MSVAPVKPPKRRTFRRVWLPILVIALATLAIAGIWLHPSAAFERSQRGPATIMTVQAVVVLLLIWLFFLSGLRWIWRGVILLSTVLAGVILFFSVHFDGDMVPYFTLRPRSIHDAALEEHRKRQAEQTSASEVQIGPDRPADFPAYRGRNRDGAITGPALVRDWSTPPRLLWRQPVGGGYASFAVAGNAAVTIEQRRDQETVVCYDTATGREHWVHSYAAFFKETLGGDGPRATPTIDGGDVFSLGATGVLCCLDLRGGKLKWRQDILHGDRNLQWGMSGSPLVHNGLVIVNPGVQERADHGAVVAYDRSTGETRWSVGDGKAGYSSPMVAKLAGKEQVVLLEGKQVAAYDLSDGRPLWAYPWETYQDINVAQPLILDRDRVFISSGYSKGCALLQVTGDGERRVDVIWGNPPKQTMRCKFTSPVAYQGFIYGLDEGILACIDERTGERKWKTGRYGHGQLLRVDDLLVILTEECELALVEATPEAAHELGRFKALTGPKAWNNFAIADGKVFVRNADEMACYDLTQK